MIELRLIASAEPEATLALPREASSRAGVEGAADRRLLLERGRVVATAGERPFLAGSFETLSPGEVLGLASSGLRTGELLARSGSRQTQVQLLDGDVVGASSTNAQLRLGRVLVERSWVDVAALAEVEPLVTPQRRLGRLLVERGILAPAELYRALSVQAEEIVLDLLGWEAGEFLLVEGALAQPTHLKLQRRTRELCVEGGRRQAETLKLRAGLPAEARLLQPPEARAGAGGAADWVTESAAAGLAVGEACRRSGLREIEALRELAAAVEAGAIGLAPISETPRDSQAAPADPFEAYGQAFRRLFATLRAETGVAQEGLNSFFLEPPVRLGNLLDGLAFGEDGDFPIEELRQRAEQERPGPRGRARALEALQALLSFCLFECRNVLPRPSADRVAAEVAQLWRGGVP